MKKKIFLGIGSLLTVVSPIAMIACSVTNNNEIKNVLSNLKKINQSSIANIGGTLKDLKVLETGELENVILKSNFKKDVNNNGNADEGDVVTITAKPKEGYTFENNEKSINYDITFDSREEINAELAKITDIKSTKTAGEIFNALTGKLEINSKVESSELGIKEFTLSNNFSVISINLKEKYAYTFGDGSVNRNIPEEIQVSITISNGKLSGSKDISISTHIPNIDAIEAKIMEIKTSTKTLVFIQELKSESLTTELAKDLGFTFPVHEGVEFIDAKGAVLGKGYGTWLVSIIDGKVDIALDYKYRNEYFRTHSLLVNFA